MKHQHYSFAILLAAALFALGCSGSKKATTNKTTEPEEKVITKPAPTGKCVTFSSSGDKDKAIKAHVLYRDYMKQDKFAEAFPFWEKAYEMAPAADGNRPFHFTDGIKIYKHFLKTESDASKNEMYKGKILALHDERIKCYQKEGYVLGRKVSDMMYYTESTPTEIFQTAKKSVDLQGNKTEYLVLFPYANSAIDLYKSGKKSPAVAREVLAKIQSIAKANINDPDQAKNKEKYKTALEQVEDLYTYTSRSAEGLPSLFDCNYYIEKTKRDYPTMPTDEDGLETILGRLYANGCDESHPFYKEHFGNLVLARKKNLPPPEPPTTTGKEESALSKGTRCLRAGDNQCAITHYKEVLDSPDYSQDKKAKIALRIAKIYYGELKDKRSARTYARKAAQLNPNWGEPYFLIGNMYASSGKDCGKGTGFNSQRTVWVAIDQWKKAISVDPGSSAASKSQQRISEYRKYMPNKEQVFMRSLKEGQSYTVPCWINESTRVRFVN